MKKKIWIPILIAAVLLAVLVIPIPKGTYKDGGTREYSALTYKVVVWNRLDDIDDNIYHKTKVYSFPDNFKSIDELWHEEEDKIEHTFTAYILDITTDGSGVDVKPLEDTGAFTTDHIVFFDIEDLEEFEIEFGSVVQITFTGGIIPETYPFQINAKSWKLLGNLRDMEYTEEWIDRMAAEKYENNAFEDIRITKIYSNCFFAKTFYPLSEIGPDGTISNDFSLYDIKLNGTLSDEWCVGDHIACTFENSYLDQEKRRVEADMLSVKESDLYVGAVTYAKPVIYLYPEKEREVSATLTLDGRLTCTYPAYNDGWKVTALPDGTLIDAKGQTYNYLYWEGETDAGYDLSKGFCVKGEDTASFLEDALDRLGLTRREANEFIVYWLPLMEQNPYNIISFQTDTYTAAAQLDIDPAPDTLIRVFMAWKASDQRVELPGQELTAPERTGFTVVEWGGTEIK